MPAPYLLQVFSQPKGVEEKTWAQWYTEEHIRDMVYFKAATTASFYRVIAGPEGTIEEQSSAEPFAGEHKPFFAIYQTEKAHPLKTLEYTTRVRLESDLFKSGQTCHDVGEFEAVDLELTGTLGAEGKEDVAPYVVHIEARKENGRHLNSWVVHEHVGVMKDIKGYRRTLIYRPNTGERYDAAESSGHTVIVDEFDDLSKDDFDNLEEALEKSAVEKQVNFNARALKLVESEGFGGKCREPMRMSEEK